jgi:hypothetical protein
MGVPYQNTISSLFRKRDELIHSGYLPSMSFTTPEGSRNQLSSQMTKGQFAASACLR